MTRFKSTLCFNALAKSTFPKIWNSSSVAWTCRPAASTTYLAWAMTAFCFLIVSSCNCSRYYNRSNYFANCLIWSLFSRFSCCSYKLIPFTTAISSTSFCKERSCCFFSDSFSLFSLPPLSCCFMGVLRRTISAISVLKRLVMPSRSYCMNFCFFELSVSSISSRHHYPL